MNTKLRPSFALILTTLLFAFFSYSVNGQTPRPNFNRERTYDVRNYIIRVSFDRAEKRVFGDTTVELKPLAPGFTQVELDAADLKFETVRTEPGGRDLKFTTVGDKIIVTLDRAYAPADLIAIRFKYSTRPKHGIYFVDELNMPEQPVLAAQIWTQGEAEEARYWFPSFDFPSDKATSEQYITAAKGETVVGNGELLGQAENRDGTVTHHYKMPVPHSTYLTSFVVGSYVMVSDTYRGIPLGYYVYPGHESLATMAFGNTKQMMQVFEELTGVKYPFNKYDQTIVRNFQFGGMENITATTLADTEVFFGSFDIGKAAVQDLVSHELAHSWFGNLVTCKNWAELWLNEGFATFMESAIREKLYGRESYMRKIRSDAEQAIAFDEAAKRPHGLFNIYAKPDQSLFDITTYNKGGAVVHTLRETIGDKAFWKGMNLYLNRHKFENVETPDLQKAMEEASGQNLNWFFEQWVYGAGYPRLEVKQIYNNGTKTLKVTVAQIQKAENGVPETFRLPMDIELKTANGSRIERLDLKNRTQEFAFKVETVPTDIVLDPHNRIPLKTVRMNSLVSTQ